MLECITCNAKNADDSKFCIICGHPMFKECKKCSIKLPLIANFCHECGTKVAASGNSSINTEQDKNHKDSETESSTRKRRLSETEYKVKINIVLGDRMLQLSTEDGGGWRKVNLRTDDDFSEIFKKILDVYFPRDGKSKLGDKCDYSIRLLDFKKELINKTQFINFEHYIKKNGLTIHKSLFFIQLWRRWDLKKSDNPISIMEDSVSSTNNNNQLALINKKPKQYEDTTVSSSSSAATKTNQIKNNIIPNPVSANDTKQTNKITKKIVISPSSSSSSSSDDDEPATLRRSAQTINLTSSTIKKSQSPISIKEQKSETNKTTKTIAKKIEFSSSSSSSSDDDDEEKVKPPQNKLQINKNDAALVTSKPILTKLITSIKTENTSKNNDDVVEVSSKKQTISSLRTSLDEIKNNKTNNNKSVITPVVSITPTTTTTTTSSLFTSNIKDNKKISQLDLGNSFTSFDDNTIGYCNFDSKPLLQSSNNPSLAGRLPQPLFSVYNSFSQENTNNDKYKTNNSSNEEKINCKYNNNNNNNNNQRYNKNYDNNRGSRNYDNYSNHSRNHYNSSTFRYNNKNSKYNTKWDSNSSNEFRYNNGRDRRNNNYKTPTQRIIEKNIHQEDSEEERRKMKIKTVKDLNIKKKNF